ncbi:unnamed protein product [Pylaiella littoralis]
MAESVETRVELEQRQQGKEQQEQRTPFRELPRRPKMVVPSSWPSSDDDDDTTDLVNECSIVNGVCQLFRQKEDATNDLIRTFETRDDDVFVCTFSKSGTTWVQQIITLLLNGGVQGEKTYTEVVPWLEWLTFSFAENEPDALRYFEAQNWTLEALKSTPNRRFMKSHANLKDLPAGCAKGLKVVYVARNPYDVCVSLYHHIKNKRPHTFSGDVSDHIRCFVQGKHMNGPWFDHVLEWWEAANADPEHILFLHYEAMLAAPQEHIRKIADFASIDHTPEILEKATAASSLSAMKRNLKANINESNKNLRKGGAGGWRDVFTVRQSEAFDKIYEEEMRASGLRMDFGEGLIM